MSIAHLLLLAAQTGFAQGAILLNNRIFGVISTRVYSPELYGELPWGTPGSVYYWEKHGNTAMDTPAGTQTYNGTPLEGDAWYAQLWAAPGANQPESALQPAWPITTFRTGVAAGHVAPVQVTLPNGIPNGTPVASFQVRVWQSHLHGWEITSWEMAEAAWHNDNSFSVILGASPLFNVENVGPFTELTGLQSFALRGPLLIPEPSSLGLIAFGLSAWAFCCRRN